MNIDDFVARKAVDVKAKIRVEGQTKAYLFRSTALGLDEEATIEALTDGGNKNFPVAVSSKGLVGRLKETASFKLDGASARLVLQAGANGEKEIPEEKKGRGKDKEAELGALTGNGKPV